MRPLSPAPHLRAFQSLIRICLVLTVLAWTGASVELTVWGDDPMTDEVDGMTPGQKMHFRIRRSETPVDYTQEQASVSFADHEPYLTHTAAFVPNGIYILRSLTIGTLEHAEASEQ